MEVEDETESRRKLDEQKKKAAERSARGRRIVVCFQRYAGEHQGVTAAPVARCGEKEA